MKSLIVTLAALVSLSAMADISRESVGNLLKNKDVKALVKKMDKQGLSLAAVEDVYAMEGVAPKCPCSSYKLTFAGYKKASIIKKVKIQGIQNQTTEIE